MKAVIFVGSTLQDLRQFPAGARREAGYQLSRLQEGFDPKDWKPMKAIGVGVREIRIHVTGEFRVIYVAHRHDTIYALHAFRKRAQRTPKADLDKAGQRLHHIRG